MKKIVKVTNVYTIKELKEVNPVGYNKAIEVKREEYLNFEADYAYTDMLASLQAFANHYYLEIKDWSFGAYSPSYMTVSTARFMELDNGDRNDLVNDLNTALANTETFWELPYMTGVYTDGFILDYFIVNNITKVTYNDIHKHMEPMAGHAVRALVKEIEDTSSNADYMEELIRDSDNDQFTIEGEIYI